MKKTLFVIILFFLDLLLFADDGIRPGILQDLTPGEMAWIRANPEVTIAIDDQNPPLNYRVDSDSFMGVTVDYLSLIQDKSGIKINIWGGTWNEALTGALNHEFDGVANASAQEERKPFLNFTESYFTTPIAFATRKDMEEISDISGFNGMVIGVVRNSSRVGLMREHCPEALIVEVDNPEEGINRLSESKVDVYVDDLPVIQHLINSLFLINLKISLLYYSEEAMSRIGLNNEYPQLVSIFNKAIAAVSPEEHRMILKKWFDQMDKIPVQNKLSLTEEEKYWLENHNILTAGVDQAWSPIEFVDSAGEYQGMSVDYLKELENLLGIHFEFVHASWTDLLKMGREGKIDLFSALTETEEREKYYLFTEEYNKLPIVVFALSSMPIISDLTELENKSVAVVTDYAVRDWMERDFPEVVLSEVSTIIEALKGLDTGKYDYYVGGLLTTGDYSRRLGYTDIRVAGDTPYFYNNRMAVRKDLAPLVPILNKAFQAIPGSRRNEIYQKWINVRYEQVADYKLIIQTASILLLGIIIVLLWNYNLKRVVKIRTREILDSGLALAKSEDNLRMIYESNPAGLFRIDGGGNIITCNPAFRQIFNFPETMDLSETGIEDLFLNSQDLIQIDSRLKEKKSQVKEEVQFKDSEGNSFWGEILLNSARDSDQDQKIINGIIIDTSQRKKMELEIRKENSFIDSLLDNLPGMFYLYDRQGRLKRWNKMHEEFTGYRADELPEKDITDYFPDPEQIKAIRDYFDRVILEGSAEIEVELLGKEGITIPLLFKAGRILIDEEEYILGFGLDMRENKRLEKQLMHSQKMEAIGTLAGGIAHDFNNVLGAIIGFTELSLLEVEGDETATAYLDQSLKASLRAKDLVKQILLFSRQGSSEMKPTHLIPIVKEVADLMRATLPASIEIVTQYFTSEDYLVCDATQIHQVFMNLMTNAAAAIEQERGIITVSLDSPKKDASGNRELRILVKDTGCGMSPEMTERIFDPFFTTKSKEKGTGLGLSVVHGIIEKHGGRIKVYSEPGQGSTFIINLPLLINQDNETVQHHEIPPKGAGRILYVDDEKDLCQIMENMLEDLGYTPVIFNDSRESLAYLRHNSRKIDLALMDKTMPHLSGLDLAGEIKKLNPGLPVIISTGYTDSELIQQAEELGITDILQKPVSKWELAETLKRVFKEKD